MADADSKRCTNCGEIKPRTEFHKKKSSKDGLNSGCKACNCAKALAWYAANIDRAKESRAEWRERNIEKRRADHRSWYERNKDKVIEASQAWRKANPDRAREAARIGAVTRYAKDPTKARRNSKAYRERHLDKVTAKERAYAKAKPDKVKALNAAWRKANPEKAKAAQDAWCRANPQKVLARNANRRAMKRNAPGSFTADQIEALHLLQRGRCAICREKLKRVFHRDHILPLIRGGSNDITNIQLLCVRCNCSKGPKDPIEHAQELGRLL